MTLETLVWGMAAYHGITPAEVRLRVGLPSVEPEWITTLVPATGKWCGYGR